MSKGEFFAWLVINDLLLIAGAAFVFAKIYGEIADIYGGFTRVYSFMAQLSELLSEYHSNTKIHLKTKNTKARKMGPKGVQNQSV